MVRQKFSFHIQTFLNSRFCSLIFSAQTDVFWRFLQRLIDAFENETKLGLKLTPTSFSARLPLYNTVGTSKFHYSL